MQHFPLPCGRSLARRCATAALISATLLAAACSGELTGTGGLGRSVGGSGANRSDGASNAGTQVAAGNAAGKSGNSFLVGSSGAAAPASPSGSPTTAMNQKNNTCASGMQSTTPVTPTVWLVVDGSSSMSSSFEGQSSRWVALRQTLMAPGGVVDSLQASVRFGLVIYAGGDSSDCVQLITVDPALNNLSTLSAQYPMNPVAQGTPTDKALEYVVNNLPVLNTGSLDANMGPVYVVLATDGQPNDNCAGSRQSGATVEQRVVDATEEGTRNGMQMYVISMAGGDTRLQSHLEMVAAATASKTPPYAPSTKGDLISAFQKVIGSASCLVSLDGHVEQGKECAGSVQLNSTALQCNKADGWMLFDPSTVQLTGAACDMFLAHTSMVIASFPCEVFSPN